MIVLVSTEYNARHVFSLFLSFFNFYLFIYLILVFPELSFDLLNRILLTALVVDLVRLVMKETASLVDAAASAKLLSLVIQAYPVKISNILHIIAVDLALKVANIFTAEITNALNFKEEILEIQRN